MKQKHCVEECCDKGIMIDDKCKCDIGSFGDDCFLNLQDIYIAPYYTFVGIYCVAFFLIFFITIRQFQTSLKTQRIPSYYTCYQYASALIGSPQNYILVLTMVLSTCKLIWLILDPFEVYKGNTTVIERLLAEIVYTILFYIYGCLLIVWYTMYDEISFNIYQGELKKERKWIFTYYKEALKMRLFIVLLVQITVSTLNGLRKGVQYPIFLMICYIFLMANFFLFIIEFIIYGSSLQTCIKDQILICRQQFRMQLQGLDQAMPQHVQKDESLSKSPESVQRIVRMSKQVSIEEQKNEIQDEVKQLEEPKLKIGQTKIKSVSFARTFVKGIRGSSFFRQESQKQLKSNKSNKPNQQNQDSNSDQSAKDLDNQFNEEPADAEINSCCLNENQTNSIIWENKEDRQAYQETVKMQIKAVKETKDSADKRREALQQQYHFQRQKERHDQKKLSYLGSGSQLDYRTSIYQQSDEDQEKFNLKSTNLAIDRKILYKIQLLVYFGILLEILFGGLSIAVLITDLIRDPIGVLGYLYASSTLQFFSLITVLKLFGDIKNQEIKNLIWIQKVGNQKNKINQQYVFSIPQEQKDDAQKLKFEQRINMNTLY
ncbi:unnamed protein product (macronuclear) [Paramecium tetraurelia]|uniref:EGF-like domain-containing protein n=1 Tax=Paramecium tetraurelia TaxID=5888 RepID=A0BXS3_PARTE|nr:uncharacterized protein GSPATT00033193001 [Paramecium tetraurelia]CAK63340.1 unnamed protein product [Paramecium tetraurelia]|eukprot:XP_001430738.1 hypothetical protein (macronuclear) [Paramecium tetraurelia strain d4-2]